MPNTNDFERRLQDAVEARAPVETAALREAAESAEERRAWEDAVLLEQAVRAWREATPSVDMADEVVARYEAAEKEDVAGASRVAGESHAGRRPSPAAPVIGLVAVLLMLLLIPLWPRGTSRPAKPAQVADAPEAGPREDAEEGFVSAGERGEAELDALVREAGTAYLGLARSAGGRVAEGAALLPAPGYYVAELPTGRAGDVSPAAGDAERGQPLEPIGRDVGKALDFLIDVVPDVEPPTT